MTLTFPAKLSSRWEILIQRAKWSEVVRNSPSVGSLLGTNRITRSGGKFRTGAKEIQIWDSLTEIKRDAGMPHFTALHCMALHRCCAFFYKAILPTVNYDSLQGGGLEPNLQFLQGVPVLSFISASGSPLCLISPNDLFWPTGLPYPSLWLPDLTNLNFPGVSVRSASTSR